MSKFTFHSFFTLKKTQFILKIFQMRSIVCGYDRLSEVKWTLMLNYVILMCDLWIKNFFQPHLIFKLKLAKRKFFDSMVGVWVHQVLRVLFILWDIHGGILIMLPCGSPRNSIQIIHTHVHRSPHSLSLTHIFFSVKSFKVN